MRILFAALAIALALIALRAVPTEGERDVERSARVERAGDVSAEVELSLPSAGPTPVEPVAARERSVPDGVPAPIDCPDGRSILIVHVIGRLHSKTVPVEGLSVELDAAADPTFAGALDPGGDARTDAEGRARFFIRPSSRVEVKVTLPVTGWTVSTVSSTPMAGESREVTVDLETLTGTPADGNAIQPIVVRSFPSLAPLAGARFRVRLSVHHAQMLEVNLTSDAEGHIAAPWYAGLRYTLVADGHTKVTVYAPSVPPAETGAAPLFIDLPKHARVWGRVVVSAEPAAGLSIHRVRLTTVAPIFVPKGGQWRGRMSHSGISDERRRIKPRKIPHQLRRNVSVDRGGNWAIEAIEIPYGEEALHGVLLLGDYIAGRRSVAHSPPIRGYRRGTRVVASGITLRAGDDFEIFDPWESTPALTIHVTYGSGRAVRSPVMFSLSRTPHVTELSLPLGNDGRAVFEHLPTGKWYYGLTIPTRAIEGEFTHTGAGDLALTVEGYDSLAGRVVDPAGRQLPRTTLRLLEAPPNPTARIVLGEIDGSFRIELVRTGTTISLGLARVYRVQA